MNDSGSNMYDETTTWNPFKGCRFDCIYCEPTFKRQTKRQKHTCKDCYDYAPHCHENRLRRIPSNSIIFACGDADIAFCPPDFTRKIIDRIKKHNLRCPHKIFYFQSKQPSYFAPFLTAFPDNVILLTTLETNRDANYATISRAPVPSERYRQFKALEYPRKVVTIEPMVDFDLDTFTEWVLDLRPEYVWLGFNSRPESVTLPEPTEEKVKEFIAMLSEAGIRIKAKHLRGIEVPSSEVQQAAGQCSETAGGGEAVTVRLGRLSSPV